MPDGSDASPHELPFIKLKSSKRVTFEAQSVEGVAKRWGENTMLSNRAVEEKAKQKGRIRMNKRYLCKKEGKPQADEKQQPSPDCSGQTRTPGGTPQDASIQSSAAWSCRDSF